MLPAVFADLLKRTMGLDATAIGPSAIEHAVRERMTVCSLPDVGAYEAHLVSSESELQALIEAAVVPETWFFRDAAAFVEMVRTLDAAPHRAGTDRIRLLSLPCSTGEEPYSMAMALLEAGVPGSRFRIDAIDISARNIAYAGRAVYGKNSFRGSDLAFRERHFERSEIGYGLSEAVREVVHFRQGNLFASDFLPQAGIYDIIFCRNLLVYFDRPTQTRAIEILGRLLADGGTAFVGPAEAGMMFNHGFVWSKIPLAFSFQKNRAASHAEPLVPTPPLPRPLPIRLAPRQPPARTRVV
jgi:chemotaxis protein methyltransferase WspC